MSQILNDIIAAGCAVSACLVALLLLAIADAHLRRRPAPADVWCDICGREHPTDNHPQLRGKHEMRTVSTWQLTGKSHIQDAPGFGGQL